MNLLKKYHANLLNIAVYAFAVCGLLLSTTLVVVYLRPDVLELFGLEEVSSELYSCMIYKDPALLRKIYSGEVELKEARRIADSYTDVAEEYTRCLENIFGYNKVWVNKNSFIIYD